MKFFRTSRRLKLVVAGLATVALLGTAVWYRLRYLGGNVWTRESIDAPARLATWPWSDAVSEEIHPGVTHWLERSSPDGTIVDLFQFDFRRNPHLELSLFDQDEDDARPFDNRAFFWERGVAMITRQLNGDGNGIVVAATNGLFFGFTRSGPGGIASHVAPVVVRGEPYFDRAESPRWMFGIVNEGSGAVFRQEKGAMRESLRQFTYASGGAQSLVRDGRRVRLPPGSVNRSVAFDRMRTTRVGIGWSRDHRRLYLLFVKEPDAEGPSMLAAQNGISMAGGWSVPDVARFFVALGVWGAINSDAGDAGQLIYRRPEGRYELVPPKWTSPRMRMTLDTDLADAPEGGTLMYWIIRDRRVRSSAPNRANIVK